MLYLFNHELVYCVNEVYLVFRLNGEAHVALCTVVHESGHAATRLAAIGLIFKSTLFLLLKLLLNLEVVQFHHTRVKHVEDCEQSCACNRVVERDENQLAVLEELARDFAGV